MTGTTQTPFKENVAVFNRPDREPDPEHCDIFLKGILFKENVAVFGQTHTPIPANHTSCSQTGDRHPMLPAPRFHLTASPLTNSSPVLPVLRFGRARTFAPVLRVTTFKTSPKQRAQAAKRQAKKRRLDKGFVTSEIETNHDDLTAALEKYCAGEVDCAGIPEMIRAVEAVRSKRPGWMDDPAIRKAILQHAAVANWIAEWKNK